MDLNGRTAIVTGGGTGIGAAASLKLAARGAAVIVGYSRSREAAEETAQACRALGVSALTVQADVAKDGEAQRLADAALEATGRIDILVNSAGATTFARHADLDAVSGEDFVRLYRVNVVGAYQTIRAAAPAMEVAGRGAIVNVASMASLFGSGSSSAYACSKGALITLTRSMVRALAPETRVNAVCPGFVGTRWFKDGWTTRPMPRRSPAWRPPPCWRTPARPRRWRTGSPSSAPKAPPSSPARPC